MITASYCAIIGLMLIGLSINVVKGRRKFGAGLGDANNIDLIRRIRAQSNLAEYYPIFILLLGFAEKGGLSNSLIHAIGLTFILGRIMHAYSILKDERYDGNGKLTKKPIWRTRGMMCTFFAVGILSLILLIQQTLGQN